MPKPKRDNPEWRLVAVPIKREMENAGFRVRFLGKHHQSRGMWVSNVPTGMLDFYAWHPYLKVSLFYETKAPGEKPTPGQRAFIADHQGSETQAVCWDSAQLCIGWLEREGLRVVRDRGVQYPFGIHYAGNQSGAYEEIWDS